MSTLNVSHQHYKVALKTSRYKYDVYRMKCAKVTKQKLIMFSNILLSHTLVRGRSIDSTNLLNSLHAEDES